MLVFKKNLCKYLRIIPNLETRTVTQEESKNASGSGSLLRKPQPDFLRRLGVIHNVHTRERSRRVY